MRRKLQIERRIDPLGEVIVRHRIFKVELVEKLTLLASDGPSWIDLVEIRLSTTESRFEGCPN